MDNRCEYSIYYYDSFYQLINNTMTWVKVFYEGNTEEKFYWFEKYDIDDPWDEPAECIYQPNLQGLAIGYVAALYQLFWAKTHPPTIEITAPIDNTTVNATVPVTVSTQDDPTISHVEYYFDDATAFAARKNTPPFSWSWDTTIVSNGLHTLKAKAYNIAGTSTESATLNISVNNPSSTNLTNKPASLDQYKSDGATKLSFGSTTDERIIVIKGIVSDPNGDSVALDIEVKRIAMALR